MQVFVQLALFLVIISNPIFGQDYRTPVGSPCNPKPNPLEDDCVINSECISSLCMCKSGYSVTSSFKCKLNYDGKCSTNSDCNTQMGLHCVDSLCKCSNVSNQDYLVDFGICVNSTMKLMFEDVVELINHTEIELMKFSNLLQIFMIHETLGNETEVSPAASDIKANSPEILNQLDNLQEQLQVKQDPISDIFPPPNPTPIAAKNEFLIESRSQLQSPQTSMPVYSITLSTLSNNIPLQDPTSNPPMSTTLPNSINSLQFPILPNQQTNNNWGRSQSTPGSILNNIGSQRPQISGTLGLPNPNGGSINQQVSNLANILPQFLAMFKQFLPMLVSFNGILGSFLFSPNAQNSPNQISPNQIIPDQQNGPNSFSSFLPTSRPTLFQVPGRIFNSIFGRNSTIKMFARRLIPIPFNLFGSAVNFSLFSNRPIPFLPFIGR